MACFDSAREESRYVILLEATGETQGFHHSTGSPDVTTINSGHRGSLLLIIGRKHVRELTYTSFAAYWIAFGPHGPRALPPPGENWMVFRYTMLGVGISFLLFWAIRTQARPAPKTMNAQYQEMTNEYLRVRHDHVDVLMPQAPRATFPIVLHTDCIDFPEPKNRTHHRCIVRRLQRQRNGAEQAKERRENPQRRRRMIGKIPSARCILRYLEHQYQAPMFPSNMEVLWYTVGWQRG